ncbi:carbohydrate ABC transporter permease [Paramicrobacterium agarici]|uniref:Carbohydrate ABC transporter membrane protein 2 (CUT1 family) n=1 Tax=Paramicrobacterium agarici TaxID=630514 RepID=A0A2A9DV14_9MICO|nr:carbohydrate ABC transporter permease [Microbacterium agarici]PFG30528.1 carbohydrate ABC transporter membrane protein 2 (CUT1 family) [Microbacterium agarici]
MSAVRTRPNVIGGLLGWVWLAIIIVPIYYVVVTSIREQSSFFSENALLPPSEPTLDAYVTVLQNDFALYFMNSVIVTASTVLVVLIVCVMAAYYVVRSRTRFAKNSFALILLGIAIPLQATIIPIYYMITQLRLYDSLLALILPSIAFAIPITVLILVNFMRDIPGELFESMHMDGAGDWRMLRSLVVPLAKPAIITVAIYDGLNVWNGFLFPLVLTQSADKRVLPLSLWAYQGEFQINIPAVLAAVTLSALPIVVLYALGRRQLVSGLTAGFGK